MRSHKGWGSSIRGVPQHTRHVNAARTGRAGGKYSTDAAIPKGNWRYPKDIFTNKDKNKSFKQLKKEGKFLPYWKDTDKDGTLNIKDCKPLNPKKQDEFENNKKMKGKGYILARKLIDDDGKEKYFAFYPKEEHGKPPYIAKTKKGVINKVYANYTFKDIPERTLKNPDNKILPLNEVIYLDRF